MYSLEPGSVVQSRGSGPPHRVQGCRRYDRLGSNSFQVPENTYRAILPLRAVLVTGLIAVRSDVSENKNMYIVYVLQAAVISEFYAAADRRA